MSPEPSPFQGDAWSCCLLVVGAVFAAHPVLALSSLSISSTFHLFSIGPFFRSVFKLFFCCLAGLARPAPVHNGSSTFSPTSHSLSLHPSLPSLPSPPPPPPPPPRPATHCLSILLPLLHLLRSLSPPSKLCTVLPLKGRYGFGLNGFSH